MALIKCEECCKEISNKAKACIHCGCPISSNDSKNGENINDNKEFVFKQSISEFFDENSRKLSIEFDAVVSNKPKESTQNKIYIKELDRHVEILVPNNIKENEKIWKKIDGDPKCELIVFTVKSISKDSNIKSIVPQKIPKKKVKENKTIKDVIKNYNPNFLVRFLAGPGATKIIALFISSAIIMHFRIDDITVTSVFVIFVLPLILLRSFYPFFNVKRYIKKNHIDDAIKNDPDCINIAILTYNLMPCNKMLWYLKKLNLEAGLEIERQLEKK